jgi:hypothetical protein
MEVRRGSKSSCSETGVLRLAELGGHAPQPSFRMRFVQVTERPSLSSLLFGPMSGKQQGSAFPRHTDNFIQHNLIDRQTMFKTNLKSGNVPCQIRFILARTALLRGNGLIGFLCSSRQATLVVCLFSRLAGLYGNRQLVPAPAWRLYFEQGSNVNVLF